MARARAQVLTSALGGWTSRFGRSGATCAAHGIRPAQRFGCATSVDTPGGRMAGAPGSACTTEASLIVGVYARRGWLVRSLLAGIPKNPPERQALGGWLAFL